MTLSNKYIKMLNGYIIYFNKKTNKYILTDKNKKKLNIESFKIQDLENYIYLLTGNKTKDSLTETYFFKCTERGKTNFKLTEIQKSLRLIMNDLDKINLVKNYIWSLK